jgi:hypothetical protein
MPEVRFADGHHELVYGDSRYSQPVPTQAAQRSTSFNS